MSVRKEGYDLYVNGVSRDPSKKEILECSIAKTTLANLRLTRICLRENRSEIPDYCNCNMADSIVIVNANECYGISVMTSESNKERITKAYESVIHTHPEEVERLYKDDDEVLRKWTTWSAMPSIPAENTVESDICEVYFGLPMIVYAHWFGQVSVK